MHIGAKTRQTALHDHNESRQVAALIAALESGADVALVSDAGTPLLSDPGYRLVAAAHAAGIRVSPVPGPSALTAALSVAGLPTDRFAFEGFLPKRPAARRARLEELAGETRTMVFFESVHRIGDFLADAIDAFGPGRPAFIGRELSKLHEQCRSSDLRTLLEAVQSGAIVAKGEFVVCVAGGHGRDRERIDVDELLTGLAAELPAKQAARLAATLTGGKRNALYARLLKLTGKAG